MRSPRPLFLSLSLFPALALLSVTSSRAHDIPPSGPDAEPVPATEMASAAAPSPNGATAHAPASISETAHVSSAVPDDATLEAQGAVIGTITIHAASIFDTEDPKENKKILRAANKLHVRTREGTIRSLLTIAPGDRYSRRALDESERVLRHIGYLYDATIRPVSYDGHTVDLDVHTRDVWTLRPALGFHRSGGVNSIHFGLQDANFFGFGKNVGIQRVSNVDRVETLASYVDPNVGRTHARVDASYSNNSDGSSTVLGLDRGFWKLDADWAAGFRGEETDRTDSLYALGEITKQFQEQHTFVESYYGRLLGGTDRTARRILAGFTYDRSIFSPPLGAPVGTPVVGLPPDRTLSYPWIGITWVRDGYVRAHDLDKLGRTEDVNLGHELSARLGWAAPAFGADRSAAMVDLSWVSGYSPGAGQIVSFTSTATGRVASNGIQDGLLTASTRYYHRDNSWSLFFVSFSAAAAANLDPDHQLLLGGDNGLRGYPLRYATGDRSFLLTVEERFFIDREWVHLVRVGAAVFADVGKVRGEEPIAAAHLGVLKDFGVGLRFGQTRSAHAAMLKIDFAVPLDAQSSGLHPQLLVTTGETF